MNRPVPFVLLLAFFVSFAFADTPRPMEAVQEAITPHSDGGATGFCSVGYYNLCSNWIWIWDNTLWDWADKAGVVFDLPADCGKLPGEECVNTHFWWYWRNTLPVWTFVSFYLYEVDADNCLVGEPLDHIFTEGPVERWNYYDGFGSINVDRVAFVAVKNNNTVPFLATDNTFQNLQVGCADLPSVAHSYFFSRGQNATIYCPPLPLEDPAGYVNLIMDAGFDCQEPTSTEPASWSGVKGLFR